MRLAAYARVSIEKDDTGLRGQEERLLEWGEQNGHELRLFSETASAGEGFERPVFDSMMKQVLDGDYFDGVVVEKLDRFGRRLREMIDNVALLTDAEKAVIIKDMHGMELDTSSWMGSLVFHIFAALAEAEREMIRERIQRGRERAKKYGTKSGKPMHRPRIPLPKDRILKLWRQGVTQKKIAEMHGVCDDTIRKRLREWGA